MTTPVPTPAPAATPTGVPEPLIIDDPANWKLTEASSWDGGFSLRLPPDWELRELQGIDSYVGEIVGGEVKLHFDYGWYSNPLADDNDPGHVVTYEEIGGNRAKLVRPKEGREGVTGVYFEQFHETGSVFHANRLQISGTGLTKARQDTAFAIFRTILPVVAETRLRTGIIERIHPATLRLTILLDTGDIIELDVRDFVIFQITIDGTIRTLQDLRPGYRVEVETHPETPRPMFLAIRVRSESK